MFSAGGIVDVEISFPSGKIDTQQISKLSGVSIDEIRKINPASTYPALAPNELSWEVAFNACKSLVDRLHIAGKDIQQVIYAGSGQWDYPFWSPSAQLAQKIEIENAHCYEITNFCNAAATAIRVAIDSISAGRSKNILVAASDRLSTMVDYHDAGSKSLFNYGDAAAAILVSAERRKFKILHSSMRTDPSWVNHFRGVYCRNSESVTIIKGDDKEGLGEAYIYNFSNLVYECLDSIGGKIDDIDYFLINQGSINIHKALLSKLGIPESKSVFNYNTLAHMGGDTFIALSGIMKNSGLKSGSIILLATSAMGFSWGITALQYDPLP